MVIIGKALILNGYSSEDANRIAQHALNQIIDDDSKDLPTPWVLAVISMHKLKTAIKNIPDPDVQSVIPDLKEIIDLSMNNALHEASSTDRATLDLIAKDNS